MAAQKFFLSISLCILWVSNVLCSDAGNLSAKSSSQDPIAQKGLVFSMDEKDYVEFLSTRVGVGSDEYFAKRDSVLSSIKGKEVNIPNLIALCMAIHPTLYALNVATSRFSKEELDQKIAEKSLTSAAVIIKAKE